MQLRDGRLFLSPSDVNDFLACEHLTRLELAAARGEVVKPGMLDPQAELIKRKGDEHEAAYLDQLRADGREVVEIPFAHDFVAAARATEEAIRDGADVVYQACLVDGDWRGFADFVERQADGSYEVADTKLARRSRPYHALQLCFYSEQVARIQGAWPERMHLVLGSQERESFRVADFAAYYRRVRARFFAALERGGETYPWPVSHCSVCDWRAVCTERWEHDDHLTLVAFMRRDWARKLEEAGIPTVAALAAATEPIDAIQPQHFEQIREQAALQVEARETGEHRYVVLPPEPERGLARLPPPSPGDLFLDLEGDPWWEPVRGLEYLFGVADADDAFTPFWAHDREEERRALEQVVDLIHERLRRHPELHVYHYAPYEVTAIKRLMGEYGTREAAVDELLRRSLFVDLYRIVREAIRVSHRSYSIKSVETFYFEPRAGAIAGGGDAILDYEEWRETGDQALLDAIEAYNADDCRSTLELRDWLLGLREEAGISDWPEPPEAREIDEEVLAEREALEEELASSGDPALELMGRLLGYHQREARPAWWAYFDRLDRTPEQLVYDADSIGLLEPGTEPVEDGKSLVYTLRFPEQEHKLGTGPAVDPEREVTVTIEAVDDAHGLVRIRRAKNRHEEPLPRALVPQGPIQTNPQRAALQRLGRDLGRYPALESVLRREPFPSGVQTEDLEDQRSLVLGLDRRHLFVQGPPGSGKTWTGARLTLHLLREGKRVGISATSHKAIHNLLDEVERVAAAEGVEFRGLKKGGDAESSYDGRLVKTSDALEDFLDEEVRLLAGTAWLFAREELDGTVDHLFVDEAGQVSLADALAMGTAARNLVLLGDPLQLAQVSQGTHPPASGVSVLEHLLGKQGTIPVDRGLFLAHTWRMHPDVCRFVSEVVYEGRLHSAEECARQGTAFGTGIRYVPVEHEGNRQASAEEAEAVAAEIGRMLGGEWTDARGVTRPLGEADFLVVAPYNAQVRRLRAVLPEGVRVGTVDKFQGLEAPVVLFSMATSSEDDVPRNLEFLFSRNRLNVAVSRARCLAVLVASPRLLEARCRTIEQMRLVNALCRLVELAA